MLFESHIETDRLSLTPLTVEDATEAARAMVEHLARVFHGRTLRALILPSHTASQVVASRLGLTCTDEVVDGEQVWLSST